MICVSGRFVLGKCNIFCIPGSDIIKIDVRPESSIAEVAGNGDSFQMVLFNVIFYGVSFAFLSTDLAPIGKLVSTRVFVLAFLHH